MKPLLLSMQAFGSYADKQTIDFAALGDSGLYLITGETGSGKTTIFDAISFALFGKASGSGREEYQMLRSDFSDEKAKCYVELEFLCGERRYYIKRAIKKSGQDPELHLPDGTNLTRRKDIDAKIVEIIGLDREQFAQIVMIAQNDFLRFLQSGTDERLKILRRIFGTEQLKQFQERLKGRVKRESDKRALLIHDFERHQVDVYKRQEQFAIWEAQIQSDTANMVLAESQSVEYDKKKQALAVATELSKKFAELARARVQWKSHSALADAMDTLRTRVVWGEMALRKVKPFAEAQQKACAEQEIAKQNLIKASEQLSLASRELEEAGQALADLPPLESKQEELYALVKAWEGSADKRKKLLALQVGQEDIDKKQSTRAALQNQLEAILQELDAFPSIEEKQSALEQVGQTLSSEIEKLEHLIVLQEDGKELDEKKQDLTSAQASFERLNSEFIAHDKAYRDLEEGFLCSQAGILAQALLEGEACPVCGSKEHPAPAMLSESDVTEAKLKKERERRDSLQTKRESQSTECGVLKAALALLQQQFLQKLARWIPGEPAEDVQSMLPQAIQKSKLAVQALSAEKESIEQGLIELKRRKIEAEQLREEIGSQCTALDSEIQTRMTRFLSDFAEIQANPQWESSHAILTDLLARSETEYHEWTSRKEQAETNLASLKQRWELCSKRKAEAETKHAKAKALTEERTTHEQQLQERRTAAVEAFENAWKGSGFPSEEEYLVALLSEEELNESNKRLSDYKTQGEHLARDILRLEGETEGKEEPDLERLTEEAESIRVQAKALSEHRDGIKSRLERISTALQELRSRAIEFEQVEKVYAAVKQLADTANGRLDFETYAQMAYFERVLRAANLRLKLMSQNRYTLLRKEESADGRKRSGLDIEVLDRYTGKARSANSLSGGESFMASLSLALGLSDVVQQSAGGVHLDAMFIDEGFGSLDQEVLELAVRTLSEMAGVGRSIGIISHVTELRERIDKQIQVEKTASGSKINLAI